MNNDIFIIRYNKETVREKAHKLIPESKQLTNHTSSVNYFAHFIKRNLRSFILNIAGY